MDVSHPPPAKSDVSTFELIFPLPYRIAILLVAGKMTITFDFEHLVVPNPNGSESRGLGMGIESSLFKISENRKFPQQYL